MPRLKPIETARINPRIVNRFRRTIYSYYRKNRRSFPWRQTSDPYHILISEIMLQQTQTSRVLSKFEEFICEFPDFVSLAKSPLRKILQLWQGLGYNRRALALHKIAQIVIKDFNGILPQSTDALEKLPGIGPYTASAIIALAYNKPTVFIETNIRAVYLHFFFAEQNRVNDSKIMDLVEQTMDISDPREWYYALFDYGAMLKQKENLSNKSAHYRKQSPFKGSNREVRSRIIKLLLSCPFLSEQEIIDNLNLTPGHIKKLLTRLQEEGFIKNIETKFAIV
jgi:A/G-specific adenine glycosylase